MLPAIAENIAVSPVAVWASESPYAYPGANVIHVLGAIFLLGGIGIVDLRLIGFFRAIPLQPLARALTPLAVAGLLLLLLSGSILFAADAVALTDHMTFRWKLALIALALANALVFRWRFGRLAVESSITMRVMALGSLLMWLAVAICGRLIAYS